MVKMQKRPDLFLKVYPTANIDTRYMLASPVGYSIWQDDLSQ